MASDSEASCISDPNFAVICSFLEKFGASCGITSPDFIELQEMLENTQEVSQELIELHVKLLRKVRKTVSRDRWERVLIKLCHTQCTQDAWELERFGYKKARLSSKLRILKTLCEMQFDLNQKFKADVNRLTANELRTQPIGRDKFGHSYWYQIDDNCQIRVYREDPDEDTWALVARDREGLLRLIQQLSDGDVGEMVLNEDSNSLEIEKPIIDTGQVSSSATSNCDGGDEFSPGNEEFKEEIISADKTDENTSEMTIKSESISENLTSTSNNLKIIISTNNSARKQEQIEPKIENVEINKIQTENRLDIIPVKIENQPIISTKPEVLTKKKKSINELAANLTKNKSTDLLLKNTEQQQEIDLSLKKTNTKVKHFSSLSEPPNEPITSIESAFNIHYIDDDDDFSETDEIELPSHMMQPRLGRPTLLGNTKKKSYSDEDDEYSEPIEEPLMLIHGEGSGRDCKNENTNVNRNLEFSDVIEESVVYFYGEGCGYDCDTGNTGNEENKESVNSEDTSKAPSKSDEPTGRSNIECDSVESVNTVSETCLDNKSDIDSVQETSKCHKIGTVMIDVKSADRLQVDPNQLKKVSRWDVGKPNEMISLSSNCPENDFKKPNEIKATTDVISDKESTNISINKLDTKQISDDIFHKSTEVVDDNEFKTNENVSINTEDVNKSNISDTEIKSSEIFSKPNSDAPKVSKFFFGPGSGCFNFNTPSSYDCTKQSEENSKTEINIDKTGSIEETEINLNSKNVPTPKKADILMDKEQNQFIKEKTSDNSKPTSSSLTTIQEVTGIEDKSKSENIETNFENKSMSSITSTSIDAKSEELKISKNKDISSNLNKDNLEINLETEPHNRNNITPFFEDTKKEICDADKKDQVTSSSNNHGLEETENSNDKSETLSETLDSLETLIGIDETISELEKDKSELSTKDTETISEKKVINKEDLGKNKTATDNVISSNSKTPIEVNSADGTKNETSISESINTDSTVNTNTKNEDQTQIDEISSSENDKKQDTVKLIVTKSEGNKLNLQIECLKTADHIQEIDKNKEASVKLIETKPGEIKEKSNLQTECLTTSDNLQDNDKNIPGTSKLIEDKSEEIKEIKQTERLKTDVQEDYSSESIQNIQKLTDIQSIPNKADISEQTLEINKESTSKILEKEKTTSISKQDISESKNEELKCFNEDTHSQSTTFCDEKMVSDNVHNKISSDLSSELKENISFINYKSDTSKLDNKSETDLALNKVALTQNIELGKSNIISSDVVSDCNDKTIKKSDLLDENKKLTICSTTEKIKENVISKNITKDYFDNSKINKPSEILFTNIETTIKNVGEKRTEKIHLTDNISVNIKISETNTKISVTTPEKDKILGELKSDILHSTNLNKITDKEQKEGQINMFEVNKISNLPSLKEENTSIELKRTKFKEINEISNEQGKSNTSQLMAENEVSVEQKRDQLKILNMQPEHTEDTSKADLNILPNLEEIESKYIKQSISESFEIADESKSQNLDKADLLNINTKNLEKEKDVRIECISKEDLEHQKLDDKSIKDLSICKIKTNKEDMVPHNELELLKNTDIKKNKEVNRTESNSNTEISAKSAELSSKTSIQTDKIDLKNSKKLKDSNIQKEDKPNSTKECSDKDRVQLEQELSITDKTDEMPCEENLNIDKINDSVKKSIIAKKNEQTLDSSCTGGISKTSEISSTCNDTNKNINSENNTKCKQTIDLSENKALEEVKDDNKISVIPAISDEKSLDPKTVSTYIDKESILSKEDKNIETPMKLEEESKEHKTISIEISKENIKIETLKVQESRSDSLQQINPDEKLNEINIKKSSEKSDKQVIDTVKPKRDTNILILSHESDISIKQTEELTNPNISEKVVDIETKDSKLIQNNEELKQSIQNINKDNLHVSNKKESNKKSHDIKYSRDIEENLNLQKISNVNTILSLTEKIVPENENKIDSADVSLQANAQIEKLDFTKENLDKSLKIDVPKINIKQDDSKIRIQSLDTTEDVLDLANKTIDSKLDISVNISKTSDENITPLNIEKEKFENINETIESSAFNKESVVKSSESLAKKTNEKLKEELTSSSKVESIDEQPASNKVKQHEEIKSNDDNLTNICNIKEKQLICPPKPLLPEQQIVNTSENTGNFIEKSKELKISLEKTDNASQKEPKIFDKQSLSEVSDKLIPEENKLIDTQIVQKIDTSDSITLKSNIEKSIENIKEISVNKIENLKSDLVSKNEIIQTELESTKIKENVRKNLNQLEDLTKDVNLSVEPKNKIEKYELSKEIIIKPVEKVAVEVTSSDKYIKEKEINLENKLLKSSEAKGFTVNDNINKNLCQSNSEVEIVKVNIQEISSKPDVNTTINTRSKTDKLKNKEDNKVVTNIKSMKDSNKKEENKKIDNNLKDDKVINKKSEKAEKIKTLNKIEHVSSDEQTSHTKTDFFDELKEVGINLSKTIEKPTNLNDMKQDESSDEDIDDSVAFEPENDFDESSVDEIITEKLDMDESKVKDELLQKVINLPGISIVGTKKTMPECEPDINEDVKTKLSIAGISLTRVIKEEKPINASVKPDISLSKQIATTPISKVIPIDNKPEEIDESDLKPKLICVDITKLKVNTEDDMSQTLKPEIQTISPKPLETIGIDNEESNDVIDISDTDPLAIPEEEVIPPVQETPAKALSLSTFKLDDTESTDTSSLIPEPIARALRNRKVALNLEAVKTRGKGKSKEKKQETVKKQPEKKLTRTTRRSTEIQKGDSSSDEDTPKSPQKEEIPKEDTSNILLKEETPQDTKSTYPQTAKRGRHRGRGARNRGRGPVHAATNRESNESPILNSDVISETSKSEIINPSPPKPSPAKRKLRILGLDIDPDAIIDNEKKSSNEETPTTRSSVRQSRRIAQIKIKEEAERRKIEEITLDDIKHKKDKKSKSSKKKKENVSTEEYSESEKETTETNKTLRKKRKHKDFTKLFNISNPWQSSTDSSTSNDEEEEDEVEEEQTEDEIVLKSDHEFSPESDLESSTEAAPLRRARTVKKESDTEDPTDEHACQKCGKVDHPEWILLCDKCDCGWHCSCLRPALLVIPEGDWFCPPCQHNALVEALKVQLSEYDKKVNRLQMEVRRKSRLAYVGISLDNVLPTVKERVGKEKERHPKEEVEDDDDDDDDHEHEDESGESDSSSESGSSTSSSSDESEPIYQLRQRRQAQTYRFNDYDELINSAIQDELEAVKGAGNQGRGKDIATIVNAEKEEAKAQALLEKENLVPPEEDKNENELTTPVVPEYKEKEHDNVSEEESEEELRVVPKHIGKKKHRKLNALDVSSEDDNDDDEDFKGTSDEEEDELEDLGSDDSEDFDDDRRGRGRGGAVRRSTRARTQRYDRDFINDNSDAEDEPRPKKKRSIWDESESEESDKDWGRRKRSKKQRHSSASRISKKSRKRKRRRDDSDIDAPESRKIKKPRIKYGGLNDSDDDDEFLTRRTRGKKINYIDALGSDSEEEKQPTRRIIDSEDEYVANEEDEEQEEGLNEDEKEETSSENDKEEENDTDNEDKISAESKTVAKLSIGHNSGQNVAESLVPPVLIKKPDNLSSENELKKDILQQETLPMQALSIPENIPIIAANPDNLNEEEVKTMMMESEEYANMQLELMAIQLAKEKKKKEREAKQQEIINLPEIKEPKKRGRKRKIDIETSSGIIPTKEPKIEEHDKIIQPITINTSVIQQAQNINELDDMSYVKQDISEMSPNVPTVISDLQITPPKRRGRGKGKKTLEKMAAAAAVGGPSISPDLNIKEVSTSSIIHPGSDEIKSVVVSGTIIPPTNIPANIPSGVGGPEAQNDHTNVPETSILTGKLGIAAPPQPFSQSQPTPSVITRMLQSQPISAQNFATSSNPINQKYFPGMLDQPPRGAPPNQFPPMAGRGRVPSPYRQSPPNINIYPGIRPGPANSPHRLRSPGPPIQQMFHSTHHSLDPSPSGGGTINLNQGNRDRNSPQIIPPVSSPMTKDLPTVPQPPPYNRTQIPINRFSPGESSPGPSIASPIRHHLYPQSGTHMQQPSPPPRPPGGNFSPYHPPPPPNYHYGAYPPAPSMAAADDALPPADYQGSPYPEHYNTTDGTIQSSEGSNSKPFDEEGSGEFGGLVSYFSSQREDDLDT